MDRTLPSSNDTVVAKRTRAYDVKMVHRNNRQPGARENIMTSATETRGIDMTSGFA